MTMFPSACIWSYTEPIPDALKQLKETAFHYIDVRTGFFQDAVSLEVQKSLGLKVSCVALDKELPAGASLDARDAAAVRKAVDFIREALKKAGDAGARFGYVGPCATARNLESFGGALSELGECAAKNGIRLSVEHVPGTALPTAGEALRFVERLNRPNVFLLVDTGHALLSKEGPWDIIRMAGGRIGCIQMNDNDGRRDRHWPLTDGRLKEEDVRRTLQALAETGYDGTIGLELNPDRASLISGFSKNRNLILRVQATMEIKSLKEPETRRKG